MEEKEISNDERLHLINKMIHEAKGYFYESGNSALIYGFSILLCSLLTYLNDTSITHIPFAPFYLFIPVFFIQAYVQIKEDKKKKAKTFTDEAIDFVWTGYFLSVFTALCGSFASKGYIIITVILILTGFATFLTGAIAKFRYSIYCGIFCLVLAAVSFFVQNESIYFLLASASVLVWIIPGFILKAHFYKHIAKRDNGF